jgi:hypothetical protein
MTMTVDTNQQRFGSLNFDNMSSYSNSPHFTNPWSASTAPQPGSQGMYVGGQNNTVLPHLNLNGLSKPQPPPSRTGTTGAPMGASYGSIPVTATSAGSSLTTDAYGRQDSSLTVPQDMLHLNRLQHPASSAAYDTSAYTTAASASPVNATYAPSPTPYQLGYAPAPMRGTFALAPEADPARRYSQSVPSAGAGLPPSGSSPLTSITGTKSHKTTGGDFRMPSRRAKACCP